MTILGLDIETAKPVGATIGAGMGAGVFGSKRAGMHVCNIGTGDQSCIVKGDLP